MRIDPPTSGQAPSRATGPAQRTGTWAVGQLIDLRVVDRLDAQTVRLETGGQTLLARTELDLAPGTLLKATVTSTGALVQLSVQAAPSAPAEQVAIASALGRALPNQAPLNETFPALFSVLGLPGTNEALPREVKAGLEALLARLPDSASLGRPASLAQAVEDAGNALESRLAQASGGARDGESGPLPLNDRKWQLLALRQSVSTVLSQISRESRTESTPGPVAASIAGSITGALSKETRGEAAGNVIGRPSPLLAAPASAPFAMMEQDLGRPTGAPAVTPTGDALGLATRDVLEGLLRDIDASLARLGTHQLQTATSALQHQAFGLFELPLRPDLGREAAVLEFEGDRTGASNAQETPFTVRLELPLGELGVFRAHIAMQGERIAVSTWSDSPGLRDLIASRLGELDTALGAHGFALLPTTLRKTQPPDALRHGTLPLVDTRA